MRCFVVVNPRAGASLDIPNFGQHVRGLFEAAAIQADFADPDIELDRQIEAAMASDAPIIAVAGGDGTVMAVVQAMMGTPKKLAILPAGTMNVLAHEVGLPMDLSKAVRLVEEGGSRLIDVGEVNGHYFLGNSMLGAPSRLAKRREGFRGRSSGRGYLDLVRAGIRALRRYPAMGLVVETGGDRRPVETRALVVAVNDYEEGVGKVMTRASLDAGELVVYALKPVTPLRVLGLMLAVLLGRWRHDQRLLRLEVEDTVRITARRKRVRVMNDGETLLLTPPLTYRLHPGALEVIVPKMEPAVEPSDPSATVASVGS